MTKDDCRYLAIFLGGHYKKMDEDVMTHLLWVYFQAKKHGKLLTHDRPDKPIGSVGRPRKEQSATAMRREPVGMANSRLSESGSDGDKGDN